jgi:hypothetical protein
MNDSLAEIAYILDRSGSMDPMQEAAITAFNDFVTSQREVPGQARLTLVQFDNRYEVPVSVCDLARVPELTTATYTPRGSTALLDAIGRTIQETAQRIESLPETEKPGKVIFAIFTDGYENASRNFTHHHVGDLISQYRDKHGWEFLFLAANQDAIASAAALHMDSHLSGNVEFSENGVKSTGLAWSRKVRSIRMKKLGEMDAQALADDAKSMNEIVNEEKQK